MSLYCAFAAREIHYFQKSFAAREGRGGGGMSRGGRGEAEVIAAVVLIIQTEGVSLFWNLDLI